MRYADHVPKSTTERTRVRRGSFDTVARLYEQHRPGYPEALFDDLVRRSGIPAGGRVLEIGPGTGQATLPLARRGFVILGLELGASMARRCRQNLGAFPKVDIRNVAFEDWELEPEAFDIVLAATAFHWVKQHTGYLKAARALKRTGRLALIWNFRAVSGTPMLERLAETYRRHAPHLAHPRQPEARIEIQRRKIVNSGQFGPVEILRYPFTRPYTADEYIGLLRTMSDHAILAPGLRRTIFREVRRLIADHGGIFERPTNAVLFLAPKRLRR